MDYPPVPGSRVLFKGVFQIKFVRFSDGSGQASLGVLQDGEVIRLPYSDVACMLADDGFSLDSVLHALELSGPGKVPVESVKLHAPITRPPKIVCIGLNYYDHAAESGMKVPEQPILFSKYATAIVGPDDPVIIPPVTQQVDYEVELGVVLGKGGKNIPVEEALNHVFGYTVCNDISARDLQFQDGQWLKGKTLDTFLPVGPVVVTADEIPDPQALPIYLKRNGRTVQNAITKDMIFSVAFIISYLSQLFTLEPGDLIATGTPPGVALGQESPDWLRPGEVLEAIIDGIGTLRNPIVAQG